MKTFFIVKGSSEPPEGKGTYNDKEGERIGNGLMKRGILFDILCGEKGELSIILYFKNSFIMIFGKYLH